jgi:protein-S-isoprenylcysteine O-methyltransferase Ste14
MYLAVTGSVVGQALLLGRLSLLAYAAGFLAVTAAFVHWYEEPTLARQFPDEYPSYRAHVPGWLPRLRPWPGPGADARPADG